MIRFCNYFLIVGNIYKKYFYNKNQPITINK
jgi:hypothetical protein